LSNMREKMPLTAMFVDEMRAAFGTEMVNRQIKRGLAGQETFFAEEAGHRVGTETPESKNYVLVSEMAFRAPQPEPKQWARRK